MSKPDGMRDWHDMPAVPSSEGARPDGCAASSSHREVRPNALELGL